MTAMRSLAAICLLSLSGALAPAQPLRLSGPVAGYYYDEAARVLRPVLGRAGAALLGGAAAEELDFASAAPGGAWLYLARRGASVLVLTSPGSEPVEFAGALLGGVDRVVWSRDGRWAVLQSSRAGLIQLVALGDGGIQPHAPLECRLRVLAVSPDGRSIVAGAPGELVAVSETGAAARLAAFEDPQAAIFSRDGRTLYAADRSSGAVEAFRDGSRWLAPALGAVEPSDLALSSDDEFLFVLDCAAAALHVFETRSGSAAGQIALEAPPAGLQMLREDLFLIRGVAETPRLRLLDTSRRAVFFVAEQRLLEP